MAGVVAYDHGRRAEIVAEQDDLRRTLQKLNCDLRTTRPTRRAVLRCGSIGLLASSKRSRLWSAN